MAEVSIIIPTHNRVQGLQRTLAALAQQTFPLADVEVIVVADGCEDDTAVFVAAASFPYTLHLIEQSGQGPAAARNAGAAQSAAPLLIFMDDDIEAAPGFVAAHIEAHRQKPGSVVIGYLPPLLAVQTGLFRFSLQSWWEAMFDRMREPGHRFAYTDLLSGNFSLAANLFHQAGGFDTSFTCHEDYELGLRLLKADTPFFFAEAAKGHHHEMTNLNRALHRKFEEGTADVALGRCYPELRPSFLMARLYRYARLPSRVMSIVAFHFPWAGDLLMQLIQASLPLWEGLRLRGIWRRVVDGLLAYWYWRGVGEELPSQRALATYLAVTAVPETCREIELDLALGLSSAEKRLNAERPDAVVLRYNEQIIGTLPYQPGAEQWHGGHLRPYLIKQLSAATLKAFALAGEIDVPVNMETLLTACDEVIAQQEHLEMPYA